MLIADAHLDLAYNAVRGRDITRPAAEQPVTGEREPETATVGLPDLRRAGVGLVCGTIFCEPQTESRAGYVDHAGAFAQAQEQLDVYRRLWDEDQLRPVLAPADLPALDGSRSHSRASALPGNAATSATQNESSAFTRMVAESRTDAAERAPPKPVPMILLIEGGDPIALEEESPEASSAAWYEAGARMVGLAWGGTRYAGGTGAPGPLTREGRRLLRQLDAAGFVHDASHLAEQSLDDLVGAAERPICASHSNCRALIDEDPRGRHLPDRHIRAIAQRGGVIGVVLYDKFLLPPAVLKKRRARLEDVVRHIDYICQLTGSCARVGIGSDLDGGFGREHVPEEIETAADLPRLAEALSAGGYSDADVRAVMGQNWVRFFADGME